MADDQMNLKRSLVSMDLVKRLKKTSPEVDSSMLSCLHGLPKLSWHLIAVLIQFHCVASLSPPPYPFISL